jgi:hypothetical protein
MGIIIFIGSLTFMVLSISIGSITFVGYLNAVVSLTVIDLIAVHDLYLLGQVYHKRSDNFICALDAQIFRLDVAPHFVSLGKKIL